MSGSAGWHAADTDNECRLPSLRGHGILRDRGWRTHLCRVRPTRLRLSSGLHGQWPSAMFRVRAGLVEIVAWLGGVYGLPCRLHWTRDGPSGTGLGVR